MRKLAVCDMEEFGRLESSEKTIAILGDRVAADGETGRGEHKQTVSMKYMEEAKRAPKC